MSDAQPTREELIVQLADRDAQIARLERERDAAYAEIAAAAVAVPAAPAHALRVLTLEDTATREKRAALIVAQQPDLDYSQTDWAHFPNKASPLCPATNAARKLRVVLQLVAANGQPVDPPSGFRVRAALHRQHEPTELSVDDFTLNWSKRAGIGPGSGSKRAEGQAKTRQVSRLFHLSLGGEDNTFAMPSHTLEFYAQVHLFSTEAERLLELCFSAADAVLAIEPARSIAFVNQSRTPLSRSGGAASSSGDDLFPIDELVEATAASGLSAPARRKGPVAAAADAVGPSPSKANEDEEKRQRQVSELPEGWLSGVQQQGQFRGQTYYYRPGDAEVTFLRPTR
jgi:hypothetical protein